MLEIYLCSIPVTFICMMIASWYDTKPYHITVMDVRNSVLLAAFL